MSVSLSVSLTLRYVVAVCLLSMPIGFVNNEARAETVSQSAAELFSNPDVSFPTVAPTGLPSALTFSTGAVDNEILLRWDVFPAGTIGTADPTRNIKITVSIQRLRNASGFPDWDPSVALFDGTNILAGHFFDNDDGTYGAQSSNSTSNGLTQLIFPTTRLIVGGAPAINDGGALILDLTLVPGAGSLTMSGFNGSLSTGPFLFDRTGPLSVLIGRSNSNERIKVRSVAVELDDLPSPVPISRWTLGVLVGLLSALALGAGKRRLGARAAASL